MATSKVRADILAGTEHTSINTRDAERSMYKALALYPMPEDPQAFRQHYENIHIPLVMKLPGVRVMRYSFDLTSPQGESPYFAVFEVEWDDVEAMAASLGSQRGQAVARTWLHT